jgi:hypothetical protein
VLPEYWVLHSMWFTRMCNKLDHECPDMLSLQRVKKVPNPLLFRAVLFFDKKSDSTWDNWKLSKLNSENKSLKIYADKEIRRSELVTLRKDVIGDKCTKICHQIFLDERLGIKKDTWRINHHTRRWGLSLIANQNLAPEVHEW